MKPQSYSMKNLLSGLLFLFFGSINANLDTSVVYVFKIDEQIAKPMVRVTDKAISEADSLNADYIIVHMNTYGGMVDAADTIRTKILYSKIPVFVFIDNNAASAGALISLAADSIYMRPGANIGAATVVNQSGEVVPDKYQSYMRSTMRSTAESHGKDTIITSSGDTIVKWRRDPKIAEAMVDPSIYIPGVIDTGKVLTFTTSEAIFHGFCEGEAENIPDLLDKAGIKNYRIVEYSPVALDKFIGFLLNPFVQGLLIMIMIGGIYFELQTPGVGFPLGAAVFSAIFYFAPLYLEGLAENWEILLFVIGIILLAVEIFVIPGFGVAGILGIAALITGLSLAMIDNILFELDGEAASKAVIRSFTIVAVSSFSSILLSLYIGKRAIGSGFIGKFALANVQDHNNGYVSSDPAQKQLIGKEGTSLTVLRPSGKVEIEGEVYDAKAEYGYIDKGQKVSVIRDETSQIYVVKNEG